MEPLCISDFFQEQYASTVSSPEELTMSASFVQDAEALLQAIPYRHHRLARGKVAKILEIAKEKLAQGSLYPRSYHTDTETEVSRDMIIDHQNHAIFILSKKFGESDVCTRRKRVRDAIKIGPLTDPEPRVERYIQARALSLIENKDLELELLTKYSGLETQVVSHFCSKHKRVHLDVLQQGGITLAERIESKYPLSMWDTQKVMLQIAQRLVVMHADGVIHRDLHADNIILVNGMEKVAIIDFEHAHYADGGRYQDAYGCSLLSAPEIIKRRDRLGCKVSQEKAEDLFALGCLTYHLITKAMVPWLNALFLKQQDAALRIYEETLSSLKQRLDRRIPMHAVLISLLDANPANRPSAEQVIGQLSIRLPLKTYIGYPS